MTLHPLGITANSKTIATMKRLFNIMMFVAVAAMGITACQNEPTEINVSAKKVTVNISGDLEQTRSYFGEPDEVAKTYPSKWSGGEQVVFSLNGVGLVEATNTLDGTRATFGKVVFDDDGKTEGTIYAFSPKGTFNGYSATDNVGGFTNLNTEYDDAYVVIPDVQTPTATSVDPSVHLLAGEVNYTGGLPSSASIKFKHVAAYAKMTIMNFTEPIEKVDVTASAPLAGSSCWYYYAGDTKGELTNANKTTITIINPAEDNYDFWFGCAPADLAEGTLSVKVYAANGDTYTKELAIAGKDFAFHQGGVSRFKVSITAANKDKALTIEDGQYVVAGKLGDVYYAMDGANQTTATTIASKEITVTDGKVAAADAAGYVWTVAAAEGGYTFFNGEHYLLASSSSGTSLKTQAEPVVWALGETGDNGYIFISPKADNRYLMFNGDNSTNKFGAYAQTNYANENYSGIYLLPIDGVIKTRLDKPALTATVQNANEIVVSWGDVTGAKDYTVTFNNGEPETVTSTEKTYAGLAYSTEYTITVVANPENEEQYIASEAASATVWTEADPNAAAPTSGYKLITSMSDLTDGEYIIAGYMGSKYYALPNNVTGEKIAGSEITVVSDYVTSSTTNLVWTITKSGSYYTIFDGTKYIYHSNGGNSGTNLAKGTTSSYPWSISYSTSGFKLASVNRTTVNARGMLMNNNNQFGGYALSNYGNSSYSGIYLFKKIGDIGGGDEPADPVKLTMSALTTTATSDSITVSWTDVSGAQNYAVSLNGDAATTVTGTTHIFTGLTASTSYTVSVVAKGDGVNYTDSDAATATVTTEAAQSSGGASSKTVTIDSSYFTVSYNKTEPGNTFTVDGYDFYGFYTLKSTTKIQMYKSQGYVANKTNLGKITKIVVTYDASDANKNCTLYVGSSERPSTTTVSASTSGNVYTYDCSAGDYSFFKLKNGSGAGYVTSIEITFEN